MTIAWAWIQALFAVGGLNEIFQACPVGNVQWSSSPMGEFAVLQTGELDLDSSARPERS